MPLNFRRLVLLPIVCAIALCQQQGKQPELGRVTFHVVDAFGQEIPYKVQSFTTRSGPEMASHFDKLAAIGIPYGYYYYSLVRGDSQAIAGMIRGEWGISASVSSLRLVTARGLSDPTVNIEYTWPRNFNRPGRISPLPDPDRDAFIRFQSLYGSEVYEYEVSAGGRFNLHDILVGDYVALLFQGGKLVCMQPIRFPLVTPKQVSRDLLVIDSCRVPTVIDTSK